MKYKVKDSVMMQQVDDEMVLLDSKEGTYFTLNETGSVMLEKIKCGMSDSDIIVYLAEVYEVSEQEAKSDYHALISELLAENLVEALT